MRIAELCRKNMIVVLIQNFIHFATLKAPASMCNNTTWIIRNGNASKNMRSGSDFDPNRR